MFKDLVQDNKAFFCVAVGVIDVSSEGFSERVGGEMVDGDVVTLLEFFELPVYGA